MCLFYFQTKHPPMSSNVVQFNPRYRRWTVVSYLGDMVDVKSFKGRRSAEKYRTLLSTTTTTTTTAASMTHQKQLQHQQRPIPIPTGDSATCIMCSSLRK